MDIAKRATVEWARWDVENDWATGHSRPSCRRLSRIRVRCDITEHGLKDAYAPNGKAVSSWPFTLYVSRRHGCVNLWV